MIDVIQSRTNPVIKDTHRSSERTGATTLEVKGLAIALPVALATPVVGLALLLAEPSIDKHWDHQPSHFWIVLGAAAISHPNAGFVVAVPIGLVIAAGFALWSAIPLDGARARWVMTHSGAMRFALLATVAGWAAWSIAELPPLDDPTPVESGSPFMLTLGVPAACAFAVASLIIYEFRCAAICLMMRCASSAIASTVPDRRVLAKSRPAK
jgi:adenylate cyclase